MVAKASPLPIAPPMLTVCRDRVPRRWPCGAISCTAPSTRTTVPASSRTAWPMVRTQARRPFCVTICISSSKGVPSRAQACTSAWIASRHSGA